MDDVVKKNIYIFLTCVHFSYIEYSFFTFQWNCYLFFFLVHCRPSVHIESEVLTPSASFCATNRNQVILWNRGKLSSFLCFSSCKSSHTKYGIYYSMEIHFLLLKKNPRNFEKMGKKVCQSSFWCCISSQLWRCLFEEAHDSWHLDTISTCDVCLFMIRTSTKQKHILKATLVKSQSLPLPSFDYSSFSSLDLKNWAWTLDYWLERLVDLSLTLGGETEGSKKENEKK